MTGPDLRFLLSGWGDLNSRPSVPQCDSSRVRPVVRRHKSCDSGPLSPTGTDYDCLQGSQGRTSVILVVILSTPEPPQKHPTKTPHQKAHRRDRVIYTESGGSLSGLHGVSTGTPGLVWPSAASIGRVRF